MENTPNINKNSINDLVPDLNTMVELPKVDLSLPKTEYDFRNDTNLHPQTVQIVSKLRDKYPVEGTGTKNLFGEDIFKSKDTIGRSTKRNSDVGFTRQVPFLSIKDDAYAKIDDNTYKPKYNGNYILGANNEDIAARNQSSWDKWANGIVKNTGKFVSYVADSTIGNVVGTINMIKEGSWSAFANNDFSKWIDKVGKELDYELPNYISEEEKNMSILRQMGTANFWAEDILHGMAFMGGAIGGELVWAGLTGGSSLALSGAKLGAKLGGKAFVKAGLRAEAGATTKGLLNTYSRMVAKGAANAEKALSWTGKGAAIGGAVNNARFLWTSAGFEAGVEARSALDESSTNFKEAINKAYGRDPSVEEWKEFLPKAQELSNKVFVANMFTVGASNILQFGSILKLGGGGLNPFKGTSKVINKKLFGQGINKATGEAIKGNFAQKAVGKTFMFLKNPLVEGNEEAMQGVYSRAMQNVLASKFDPSAMNEHYTGAQAIYDGIKDSYGTKEGQKEFFIGALIGKIGGIAGGTKSFMSSLPSGYNAMYKDNVALAESMKESNAKMETVANRQVERSLMAVQQLAHSNNSTKAMEAGNTPMASVEFHSAQRAKMQADYDAGMLDDTVESFNTFLDKINEKDLAKDYGVDISEVKGVKENLSKEYASQVKIFKLAAGAAEALAPTVEGVKDLKNKHYKEEVTHSLFMGALGMQSLDEYGKVIETTLGRSGFADVLKFYTGLSKEDKNKTVRIDNAKKKIATLQDEYVALQQEYSTLQETKPRTEENKAHVSKVASNRAKAAKVLEKQQTLQSELDILKEEIKKAPANKTFSDILGVTGVSEISTVDLENVIEHLNELDGYIESLEKRDPHAAETVKQQILDFKRTSENIAHFQTSFTALTDNNFNYNKYKGIVKLFTNPSKFQTPKDKSKLSEVDKKIEELIESEGMDEYSAFQYRVLTKMQIQMAEESDFTDFEEKLSETVSNEDWKEYTENRNITDEITNSIVDKLINNEPLSLREKQIYEKNEEFIKSEVVKAKKAIGDSIKALRRQRLKVSKDDSLPTTLDVIKDLIDKIFKSKEYLEGLGISDFSETDVPTEKDYRDVNRWEKTKGNLSPRLQSQYDKVKEKINKWGQIEGTFSGKYSLGGLYNQMFALEELEKTKKEGDDITDGIEISEVVNSEDIEMVANKRHYNILQSYDKVFFSRSPKGIHIHNINLKGFFDEIIGKITMDRVNFISINKKTMSTMSEIEDAIKEGMDFRDVKISYQSETGVEKIINITRGDNNELILPQQSIDNINADSNLKVVVKLGKSKLMTNYFAVLKLINGKLEALASNFIDKSAASQDASETQKLKKGDILTAEVDLKDEWNKELLAKYKKGKITIEELRKQIKIRLIDGVWNLAGVLKAETNNAGVVFDETHFDALVSIREQAVNKILTNILEGDVIAITTIKVEDVYLGHPILNINEDFSIEQNEFTVDNVDSVVDVGYIENGQIKTRSGDRSIIISYVDSVVKDKTGKYKGKRVPFVVMEVGGKRVAYPVSLNTETVSLVGQVDAIINELETSDVDKAIKINTLLSENGFDVSTMKIMDSNFRGKMKQMHGVLSSVDKYMDLALLLDENSDVNTLLINNVLIDIDPKGDKFHSPKVKIDLGESKPKPSNKPSANTESQDVEGEDNLFTQKTEENGKQETKQESISTQQQPTQGSSSRKAKTNTKNTTKKVPKTSLGNVYKRALNVLDKLRGGSSDVLVLEYFIGGGKITKSALESFFGVGNSEITLRKTFIGDISVFGREVTTMDGMADYISSLQEGEDRISNDAIRNSLENYISNFQNKTEMAKNVLSTFSNLEKSEEETMNEQEEVFGEDETLSNEAVELANNYIPEQLESVTEETTYEDLITMAKASGSDQVFSEEDIANMSDEQLVIVSDIVDFPTRIYEEQERRKEVQEENNKDTDPNLGVPIDDVLQSDNQVEADILADAGNVNIVDSKSDDIISELNKLKTPQEKLNWLREKGLITPIVINGRSYNSIDYSDRIMVLAKIGKYNIPFYISTGQAGKKNVKAGNWYAVFGIGESGWINKGTEELINKQYNFPIFQKIAKILNEGVGTFNNEEFVGDLEYSKTSIMDFNSQMNLPITPAKESTDSKVFWENVNNVLNLVNNELINVTQVKPTQEQKSQEENPTTVKAIDSLESNEKEVLDQAFEENKEVGETKEEFVNRAVVAEQNNQPIKIKGDRTFVEKFRALIRKITQYLLMIGVISTVYVGNTSMIVPNKTAAKMSEVKSVSIDLSTNDSAAKSIYNFHKNVHPNSAAIVLDKLTRQITIYDTTGNIIHSGAATVGETEGQDTLDKEKHTWYGSFNENQRVTPSGEYTMYRTESNHYGTQYVFKMFNPDYSSLNKNSNILPAFHSVVTDDPSRVNALNSKTVVDNNVSFGCISIGTKDFKNVEGKLGKESHIYIIPDTKNRTQYENFLKERHVNKNITLEDFLKKGGVLSESLPKSPLNKTKRGIVKSNIQGNKINIPSEVLNTAVKEQNKKCK